MAGAFQESVKFGSAPLADLGMLIRIRDEPYEWEWTAVRKDLVRETTAAVPDGGDDIDLFETGGLAHAGSNASGFRMTASTLLRALNSLKDRDLLIGRYSQPNVLRIAGAISERIIFITD